MKKLFLGFVCLLSVLFLSSFSVAAGASGTLFLSPSSRLYDVGDTFSVTVSVSSPAEAMNAAAGVISFSSDKLQVTSVSKTGSIFSLWAQEPAYSNSAGTVSFEGVVLNPGYTGSNGKILTITFRAKTAGTALVRFSSGSVLANDGEGTNILSSMGSAQYTIGDVGPVAPESSTETTPEAVVATPNAPAVSSETHPSPNEWYTKKDAIFSWKSSGGVTGVRTLVSQQAKSLPTELSLSPIFSKEYRGLDDGIWYAHVQLRNSDGWGSVSHFRFQIDTQKPSSFDIQNIASDDETNPRIKFFVSAKDSGSGISRYEFQIDNTAPVEWRDDGTHIYETGILSPGRHVVIAKVFDKAGNFMTASLDLSIKGIPMPVVVSYNQELHTSEPIVVHGTSIPNATIQVEIKHNNEALEKGTAQADKSGKFVFVYENETRDGLYSLTFQAVDERGGKSLTTTPISVYIAPSGFAKFGSQAISVIAFGVVIIACLLLLIVFLSFLIRRFTVLRKDIRRVVVGVEETIHTHFEDLRDDVREALHILEHVRNRRELNDDEEKIERHLSKSLTMAEQAIKKDLKNFEKKIK